MEHHDFRAIGLKRLADAARALFGGAKRGHQHQRLVLRAGRVIAVRHARHRQRAVAEHVAADRIDPGDIGHRVQHRDVLHPHVRRSKARGHRRNNQLWHAVRHRLHQCAGQRRPHRSAHRQNARQRMRRVPGMRGLDRSFDHHRLAFAFMPQRAHRFDRLPGSTGHGFGRNFRATHGAAYAGVQMHHGHTRRFECVAHKARLFLFGVLGDDQQDAGLFGHGSLSGIFLDCICCIQNAGHRPIAQAKIQPG